jgi:hypothetical protein
MRMSKIVMNSKTITSVSAIVLAMTFAGPAAAQTTIGGVEVSASDLPKVQEQCDRLTSGPAASLSTDSSNDSNNSSNSASGGTSGSGGASGSGGGSGDSGSGSASGGASAGGTGSGTGTGAGNEGDRSTEVGTLSGGGTALNLASITAEDCAAAGLSSGAANPDVTVTNP